MNVTYNPRKWARTLEDTCKNVHGSTTMQKNEKTPQRLLIVEWIHCGIVLQWNVKKQ